MSIRGLRMAADDNVVTLLAEAAAGDTVEVVDKKTGEGTGELCVLEDIPCYHKAALVDITRGEQVCKYGEVIGVAIADIPRGAYVHVHNIESAKTRNHD